MIDKVKEFIAEELAIDVSEIKDDSNIIDDLGVDSLGIMNIVQEIETEFDTTFDEEVLMSIKTPQDIVKALESK